LLVLLGVVACVDEGRHRRGPKIKVKPVIRTIQGSDVEFNFRVMGKLPLEEERVEILKLLNQHESIESDFDISFRNSTESDGENKERHVLHGFASLTNVTCEDQRKYRINYVAKEREIELDQPEKRPNRVFRLAVKGCKRREPRPEPEPRSVEHHRPHGPRIFVRPIYFPKKAANLTIRFKVVGRRRLDEDRVEILKLLNRTSSIESDFDISFKDRDDDDDDDDDEEDFKFNLNEDDEEDDDHHRRYVLDGKAVLTDVDCDDQRKYRIRYACRERDDEELEFDHHHRRKGMFALRVRGCPRPKPDPRPRPDPRPKPDPRPEPIEY